MNIAEKEQTHRYRELSSGYQWQEGKEEVQDRDRELRDIEYYE